jgi:hypothetical protein
MKLVNVALQITRLVIQPYPLIRLTSPLNAVVTLQKDLLYNTIVYGLPLTDRPLTMLNSRLYNLFVLWSLALSSLMHCSPILA